MVYDSRAGNPSWDCIRFIPVWAVDVSSTSIKESANRMEFRLVYEGPLKAVGGGAGGKRTSEKHAIRKVLHKQLSRLWEVAPTLRERTSDHMILNPGKTTWDESQRITSRTFPYAEIHQSLVKTLGANFERCGYKFVPLVSNYLNLSCALDILFLRRDMPGGPLIRSGGDIDNRLKVLF